MQNKVLAIIQEAIAKAAGDPASLEAIRKAGIVTTTGFGIANVEEGVRNHVPIIETFFRDNIFRRPDAAGNSSSWKVLTSYDTLKTLPYVPDGKRAGIATKAPGDASAIFGMIGIEDSITKMAAQQGALLFGGEPAEAAWFKAALFELFGQLEDSALVGANKDYVIAKPTTVAGVNAAGGTVNSKVWCRIVPLSWDGYKLATLAGGCVKQQAITTGASETYNINGGCGIVSDAMADGVTAGAAEKITWTWDAVKGAAAYAVFCGVDAGGEPATSAIYLQAIVTCNTWVQTVPTVTTYQTLAGLAIGTTDYSYQSTAWRGLVYQMLADSGASYYYRSLSGAALTMTNGLLNEFVTALDAFWAANYIEPEFIALSNAQSKAIVALALSSSNPRVQFSWGSNQAGDITVGARVTGIVSHITGKVIPVKIVQGWPSGWILFGRWNLPNTINASPKTAAFRSFGGAWQIDWTPQTLTDYSGVYEHGGVELYCPFAWGLIQDVG